MALSSRSMFLYGLNIGSYNCYLDFKVSSGGPTLIATLNFGYYSLSGLMSEIVRAMTAADPLNTYVVTADRTILSGMQNRVTISTSGSFLSILFGTGPHYATSVAQVIGFNQVDYTGSISYSGSSSAGTPLLTTAIGYNYLGPEFINSVFGAVNISATGDKEAIVFQIQKFFEVEFKYEPKGFFLSDWVAFLTWAIQQRRFEFTPEITSPSIFYDCTLEHTSSDGKGLGFTMKEMLPQFPGLFQTGLMRFRKTTPASGFVPGA